MSLEGGLEEVEEFFAGQVVSDNAGHTPVIGQHRPRAPNAPEGRERLHLGELQSSEKAGWTHVTRIMNPRPNPCRPLFDTTESAEPVPEKIEIRVRGAHLRRTRDFGALYLGRTRWRALKLDKLLQRCIPSKREGLPGSVVAAIPTWARFCEPSSE